MKKAEVGVEFLGGFLPYYWIFLFSIINIQKNIELSSITYYALFSEKKYKCKNEREYTTEIFYS